MTAPFIRIVATDGLAYPLVGAASPHGNVAASALIPVGRCRSGPRLAVLRDRSRLRVSALAGAIAIALAGCQEGGGEIVAKTGTIGRVQKTCDEGRAIYTYKSGYAGGIAVVENAPECAQAKPAAAIAGGLQ